MGTAPGTGRHGLEPASLLAGFGLAGKAVLIATALLFTWFTCPPVRAQAADADQTGKSAARGAKAVKAAKPRAAESAVQPAGAKAPPQKKARMLDPDKVDPLQLNVDQVDPKKLNARSPNAWIVLGLLEMGGGNLAGSQASLERAVALGEERRNKAAVAAASLALGRIYTGRLGLLRAEARNVAAFGSNPDDELTGAIARELEGGKAAFQKALAIHKVLGRKDGMAAGYARLGELYSTAGDFDQAQVAIGEALALNKALQRKKELAANYRALAATHRYDLDQADTLLKEAAALHEALGLKEEMATDYERLAAINTTRGEPYEAERLYKQALALTPRTDQVPILRALERLYRDRNDPGQAAEREEEASALRKELQKDGGGRRLLFSSSLGLYMSGVAAKSQVAALERAVPIEKSLNHWTGLATSYTLLGLHYRERAEIAGEKDSILDGRAEALFREALALDASRAREGAMAFTFRELTLLLDKRGKTEEVDATLKEALALHKKLGKDDDMAQLYFSLGYGSKNRGDAARACAQWRAGALLYPGDRKLVEAMNLNKCATGQ